MPGELLSYSTNRKQVAMATSFPKQTNILERFNGRDADVESILWPVLPVGNHPALAQLQTDAAEFINWAMSPQEDFEREYLAKMSRGEYHPELLFATDSDMLTRAAASPAMAWKVRNLQKGLIAGLVEPL